MRSNRVALSGWHAVEWENTMETIKFVLINPTSPIWRVKGDEWPRQSRYFRFSMLPLNLGYRHRKNLDGDFRGGEPFEPLDFEPAGL